MYSTILVPLDGSKRAEAILPHVERIALAFESRVIIIQVVEADVSIPQVPDNQPDMWLQALETSTNRTKQYLAEKQGELRELGIVTETRIANGPVVDDIIKIAKIEQADLIAMASHGRTGLARVVHGSVAAGVLQRVDRPVLLVRA